ncbi:uncharacterized protein MONBRDRAFT_29490 [Monosiga brevicollis MX1]|uniref:Anti-proliferative protein domain-containing protein n=1 Tax=Monosiga brevicollis TaxID=81824 RepID=A9VB87_MONBE|nr:uncharacterized protein MONBRDRAFT_29490 [Monosiga brevicollis MX1]EDQ85194.1 predicted protein [Monosiga brevicollis MX1]|eukprot:XP_001750019.1 hypothetical protein [Monosiga brevicollis MX1]
MQVKEELTYRPVTRCAQATAAAGGNIASTRLAFLVEPHSVFFIYTRRLPPLVKAAVYTTALGLQPSADTALFTTPPAPNCPSLSSFPLLPDASLAMTLMEEEVAVAARVVDEVFLADKDMHLRNNFRDELEDHLLAHVAGHCYNNPVRGSGYRCLRAHSGKQDAIVRQAAQAAGALSLLDALPMDWTMWVDPGCVAYRVADGMVQEFEVVDTQFQIEPTANLGFAEPISSSSLSPVLSEATSPIQSRHTYSPPAHMGGSGPIIDTAAATKAAAAAANAALANAALANAALANAARLKPPKSLKVNGRSRRRSKRQAQSYNNSAANTGATQGYQGGWAPYDSSYDGPMDPATAAALAAHSFMQAAC